jgi:hypothetical protein
MFRKMLVSAIIAAAVFATGAAVYAEAGTVYSKDDEAIFELQIDRDESKTFDREYVVSGNAKEGTEITIELYWFSQEDEKSIISNKKPSTDSAKKGEWVLQQTEELVVGASSIFAEPIYLSLGKNKIVIFATDVEGNSEKKTLKVERFLEEQANKEVNGSTLNKFVEDISSSISPNN